MNKNDLQKALEIVKKNSPKRKFKQSYDLVMGLKGLDLKKTENKVDLFAQLHHERGKKVKVCALIGPELEASAKEACDKYILLADFEKYQKDPKLSKKLTEEFDFFVAQANLMPKVAQAFGKVLGTRGKMPNPKAGCIVPPNANLKAVVAKLQNTVRIKVIDHLLYQCRIGSEENSDEQVLDNAMVIYNALTHALPAEQNNIKAVYLKLTMGPSVKVGGEVQAEAKAPEKKEAPKEEKTEPAKKESKTEEKVEVKKE